MRHVEFRIDQNIGVGQGYFIEENAPGIDALVELENTGHVVLRLVITRFNNPTISVDVMPKTKYAIEVSHIQTVGILVLSGHHYMHDGRDDKDDRDGKDGKDGNKDGRDGKHSGRGLLTIIPNFMNINLD